MGSPCGRMGAIIRQICRKSRSPVASEHRGRDPPIPDWSGGSAAFELVDPLRDIRPVAPDADSDVRVVALDTGGEVVAGRAAALDGGVVNTSTLAVFCKRRHRAQEIGEGGFASA